MKVYLTNTHSLSLVSDWGPCAFFTDGDNLGLIVSTKEVYFLLLILNALPFYFILVTIGGWEKCEHFYRICSCIDFTT